MSKSICLLLTATIAPKNVPNLARANAQEREQDYADALKKWLSFGLPIVFCENSATHSPKIAQMLDEAAVHCEYLTFESVHSSLGKSHGEAEIINYVFEHSKIAAQSAHVVKLTGRYFIKNFGEQLAFLQQDSDVSVVSNLHDYLRYGDSRFVIGSPNFYQNYLKPKMTLINEAQGFYMEHAVARAVHAAIADGLEWRLPAAFPIYEGVFGTKNTVYKQSFFQKWRDTLLFNLKKRIIKKVLI